LTEIFLAGALGILCGLYTWTPFIQEYKVHEGKILEERKKLQVSDEKIEKKEVEETSK